MAVIGNSNPTLVDVARRSDPDGKISTIIELLNDTNEILNDMVVKECNNGTSNITTIRTGLPEATWRKLNYGVQPSKSQTAQVTDTTGMLEAYAEVDKKLVTLNGNSAAFRLSEDIAFLESMNQQMASTLFYGDISQHPERFEGLHSRFNSHGTDKTKSSFQVIDAGGTGSDNTSIWIVIWGENTVHALYPKGSTAGFNQVDLGEVTLEDENGGKYQGLRTHYSWDIGLTVRDYRYVARIANIDVSDLGSAGDSGYSGPDLIKLLIKAVHRIKSAKGGRAAIYVNDTVYTALDLLANYDNRLALKVDEVDGSPVVKFRGIPIRKVDAILDTEDVVPSA